MFDAYVVMKVNAEVAPRVQGLMRECVITIQEASLKAELVDEEFREHSEDLKGFVLKASGPVAYEPLLPLIPKIQGDQSEQIAVRLMKGVGIL